MKATVRERHHRMEAKAARRRRRIASGRRGLTQAQQSREAAAVVYAAQRGRYRDVAEAMHAQDQRHTAGQKRRFRTRIRDLFRRGRR